jgi:L-alanine-DL-glutamate epimerase-like enolase superfamily enzyme
MELMADANHAYEAGNAIRLGRELERLGFLWFEEPVLPDDLAGSSELCRALDLEIAGGENLYGARAFGEAIRRRALDILQPDVTAMGGITEIRKVVVLAEAGGIRHPAHLGDRNRHLHLPPGDGDDLGPAGHVAAAAAVDGVRADREPVPAAPAPPEARDQGRMGRAAGRPRPRFHSGRVGAGALQRSVLN